MARMVDLIRASAVPSNLMQSAAKGSLSVPAQEMIDERFHAQLAHPKRILHHDAVQLPVVHGLDEDVAGVEADEADLPRFAGVFERQKRAGGR